MDEKGLTNEDAAERLQKYGLNELKRAKKTNLFKRFALQFTSPFMLLLIIAAGISLSIGFFPNQPSHTTDALLILIIVAASGIAGFIQDYKAEKTIESLQTMMTPHAKVIRDSIVTEIPAAFIVPGDLLALESGDAVPADAKLIDTHNLTLDESLLTGESRAVRKQKNNTIYMNTHVFSGNATARVLATGMRTNVGSLAEKLQELTQDETPFQKELSAISTKITWATILLTIIMTAAGFVKFGAYLSILTAISLAVAAIPEALPAVITISLALGGKIMAEKKALIRRLSAVESIGSVNVICTDKTGTLTSNEMTVTKLFFNNAVFDIAAISYKDEEKLTPLFLCGALCNNAYKITDATTTKYVGSQTEIALKKISQRFSHELLEHYHRADEIPFTPERKMMSVICTKEGKNHVYVKGAPEILIEHCTKIYSNEKITKLTPIARKKILEHNKTFASDALRVLGFAYKETKQTKKDLEKDLIWLGLQAMIDPPRPEVAQALTDCTTAGIRVIMLTGDNPLTAKAIARAIGLATNGVLQGSDIDALTDIQLEQKLAANINIFARVSPFAKLRILEILKKNNTVAMTGDGVNDALALKKADVGIAMGIRGTDVAQQASDIILLDDNFATIKNAIHEGRKTFDNIQKFLNYLLTCNVAEIAVLFLATLFLTLTTPILLPVQLLWINLLTDGLPALALGIDPARPDTLTRPPRKKDGPIIDKRLAWLVCAIGIEQTIILFLTYFLTLPLGFATAQTTLFTGFVIYEFIRIASIRAQENIPLKSNKWLIGALLGSILLQVTIMYTPLADYFHIVALGLQEWFIIAIGGIIGYFCAIVLTKFIMTYVAD